MAVARGGPQAEHRELGVGQLRRPVGVGPQAGARLGGLLEPGPGQLPDLPTPAQRPTQPFERIRPRLGIERREARVALLLQSSALGLASREIGRLLPGRPPPVPQPVDRIALGEELWTQFESRQPRREIVDPSPHRLESLPATATTLPERSQAFPEVRSEIRHVGRTLQSLHRTPPQRQGPQGPANPLESAQLPPPLRELVLEACQSFCGLFLRPLRGDPLLGLE